MIDEPQLWEFDTEFIILNANAKLLKILNMNGTFLSIELGCFIR